MSRRLQRALIAAALLVTAVAASGQTDVDRQTQTVAVLSESSPHVAYSRFIDLYLLVSPHADKKTQQFIEQARLGNSDAFAAIAYQVWIVRSGFRTDRRAAMRGLERALNDGSATAAGAIGRTFEQPPFPSPGQAYLALTKAIYWYGVAVGMGEPYAHKDAQRLIEGLAGGNLEEKNRHMENYNKGIGDGVTKRRK